MPSHPGTTVSDFEDTIWTQVRQAGAGRATAINHFVARYRPAVVRFACQRGLGEADAQDVAQEVFLRLFEHHVLERADPRRGRFRHLLLAIVRHVLGHLREQRQALKRGGGKPPLSLSLDLPPDQLVEEDTDPDFDREWVACLLASALRRLEGENDDYYRALSEFLVAERSHREVAQAMGKTEAMVRNYISRGRARLAAILRQEIRTYTVSASDFDAELRYLSRFLGPGGRQRADP